MDASTLLLAAKDSLLDGEWITGQMFDGNYGGACMAGHIALAGEVMGVLEIAQENREDPQLAPIWLEVTCARPALEALHATAPLEREEDERSSFLVQEIAFVNDEGGINSKQEAVDWFDRAIGWAKDRESADSA